MKKSLFVLGAVGLASLALAQPPNGRRPPPEAFEACRHQEEGTLCSVETPHGRLEGTCRTPPEESQLVCVPHDRRPRGSRER